MVCMVLSRYRPIKALPDLFQRGVQLERVGDVFQKPDSSGVGLVAPTEEEMDKVHIRVWTRERLIYDMAHTSTPCFFEMSMILF